MDVKKVLTRSAGVLAGAAAVVVGSNLLASLSPRGYLIVALVAALLFTVVLVIKRLTRPQHRYVVSRERMEWGPGREVMHKMLSFERKKSPSGGAVDLRLRKIVLVIAGIILFLVVLLEILPSWSSLRSGTRQFLLEHNLVASFCLVFIPLQFTLRKNVFQRQTWKKISDPWLKWTGIPALSVGGFGFIALNKEQTDRLLKITTDAHYVDMSLLTTFYILSIVVFVSAHLCNTIGKAHMEREDDNKPMRWFLPTFILAWLTNFGLYSLFVNGIFLTLHAHLAGA